MPWIRLFNFSQGFRFDLPDSFPREIESLTQLFESICIAFIQAKPHP